jgi:hypothetical protein
MRVPGKAAACCCCLKSPSACGTARCALVAFATRQFCYFSDATVVCRGDDDNDGNSLCGLELYCSTLSARQSHVLPTLMHVLKESWLLSVTCLATTQRLASRREQRMRKKLATSTARWRDPA